MIGFVLALVSTLVSEKALFPGELQYLGGLYKRINLYKPISWPLRSSGTRTLHGTSTKCHSIVHFDSGQRDCL
jgi:hypothetical protein